MQEFQKALTKMAIVVSLYDNNSENKQKNEENTDYLKAQFRSLSERISKDQKKVRKMSEKINIKFSGYRWISNDLSSSIIASISATAEEERRVAAYRNLWATESEAIPRRIEGDMRAVVLAETLEARFQARYAEVAKTR